MQRIVTLPNGSSYHGKWSIRKSKSSKMYEVYHRGPLPADPLVLHFSAKTMKSAVMLIYLAHHLSDHGYLLTSRNGRLKIIEPKKG